MLMTMTMIYYEDFCFGSLCIFDSRFQDFSMSMFTRPWRPSASWVLTVVQTSSFVCHLRPMPPGSIGSLECHSSIQWSNHCSIFAFCLEASLKRSDVARVILKLHQIVLDFCFQMYFLGEKWIYSQKAKPWAISVEYIETDHCLVPPGHKKQQQSRLVWASNCECWRVCGLGAILLLISSQQEWKQTCLRH